MRMRFATSKSPQNRRPEPRSLAPYVTTAAQKLYRSDIWRTRGFHRFSAPNPFRGTKDPKAQFPAGPGVHPTGLLCTTELGRCGNAYRLENTLKISKRYCSVCRSVT